MGEKAIEIIMDELRPNMTGDAADWAHVLGVIERIASRDGNPYEQVWDIRSTIKAFDRLRKERQRQIVEADLDEIRDSFFREGR
jgi:hypothetical protein